MKKFLQSVITIKSKLLLLLFAIAVVTGNVFSQYLNTGVKSAPLSKTESIEDWETGGFTQFDWQTGGNSNWSVTDYLPYEGIYCARSGIINHSQLTWLSLTYDVYAAQDISFWFRVSSEANYDYLRFYIDGVEQDSWSGIVAWQQVSFPVSVGTHIFKWQYDKDVSVVAGDDAAFIDYIVFPPMELQALFSADTTVVCEGDAVHFYDESVGPITQWSWVFEGATPATSTEQNPVVGYGTSGSYDVYLEVSDGIETAELYMANYITVGEVPGIAPTPTGITYLCASWGNTSYSTSGLGGITTYAWLLEPVGAGSVSGTGTNVTVIWDEAFLGIATLKVAGINYCGTGIFSNPITITRYLPTVTLQPFNNVSITTPPFALTGGAPSGGTYSGPGVSNGIFDPAAAGLGTHTITYTYTDLNLCTNSAENTITVTLTTGLSDFADGSAINIFPNPNNGSFVLDIKMEINGLLRLKIVNSMSQTVFEDDFIAPGKKYQRNIDLSTYSEGVYYLHITGKENNWVKKIILEK